MKTLTQTQNNTFDVNGKEIETQVRFDEIVDYNEEHGNEENSITGICVNVMGDIGDNGSYFGQVQWDSQNKQYSTDCDGNALYDEVKAALLSNFDSSDLYDKRGIESDLHCDLMNDVLPEIIKNICDFAEAHADAYRGV